MKHWITALGVVVSVAGSGCKSIVLDPIQSQPSAQQGGGAPALAMRYGDWSIPSGAPDNAFEPVFNLPSIDPDALVLFFSDAPLVCAQPAITRSLGEMPCDASLAFTETILVIPPDLDRPGLLDLTNPRIGAYQARRLPECGGGGGDAFNRQGTLEIVSSDANSLSVKLSAGPGQPDWPSLDGEYTVERCGAAPPEPAPSPAIAVPGATLSAPPDGPAPDTGKLYLVAGSAPETCADPWSSIHCTGQYRLVIGLPPDLQHPGVIELDDPAITATYAASLDNPVACSQNDYVTGSFPRGTVEILGIDASSVAFRIYGANLSPDVWLDVDGLYSAAVCP